MREIIAKRPIGRPKASTMGIMERIERYRFAEKCAEFTPQVIALWEQMVEDERLPHVLRLAAADRLMDRAYGRPAVAVQVDQTTREMAQKKIIHEIRWMSPDPNDRSNVIEPEPD
jgi:hypothetical protein